jgi:CRP/FNR family transcriptional regulator, nitrogen fixation regulation protein
VENGQPRVNTGPNLGRIEPLAVIMSRQGGEEICIHGDPAEHWYQIVEGAARLYLLEPDGRRVIVGFLLPGELFGFTTKNEFDFTVEAVSDPTWVAAYPRRRLEMLADSDPGLARHIRQQMFEAMARLQAHLRILGRVTAFEKVACFLLEMSERLSDSCYDEFYLPVSRNDIAEYLCISVETVSRSLSDLKRRKVIWLAGRSVKFVSHDFLENGPRRKTARGDCVSSGRIARF